MILILESHPKRLLKTKIEFGFYICHESAEVWDSKLVPEFASPQKRQCQLP